MGLGSWLMEKIRRAPSGAAAATTSREPTRKHRRQADRFGYSTASPRVQRTIEATYDALDGGSLMRNAWVNADLLTADEANNAGVRLSARSKSRYECLEANSFLKGAIHTVSQDMIGRGPRLQMQLTGAAAKWNKPIEKAWRTWSRKTRFAKTLRVMANAKIVDGEAFAMFTTSRTVKTGFGKRGKIPTLYVKSFEADRCTSIVTDIDGPLQVDGLEIDTDSGEVVAYFIHDAIGPSYRRSPRRVPASEVCHWFRQDRPGQHRGIPELLTSLPLCSLLREYTLAVISAARTAAKHSAVLESTSTNATDDEDDVIPLSAVDIDYDMLTALPKGTRLIQLKAEQPTSTYKSTRDCILGEIVRPLQSPLNIVLGSSQEWNYASTQADHVTYDLKLLIEREECETEIVEPTFEEWWREMQLMGKAPSGIDGDEVEHQWFWDRRRDADPQTMAAARETNLKVGATNREHELGLFGTDIESHDETAAKSLGVTVEQYRMMLARSMFGSDSVDAALQSSAGVVGLNNGQVQGLVLIVQQVGAKTMSPAAARAVAAVAFPQITPDQLLGIFPDDPAPPADPSGSPAADAASGAAGPGIYTEIGQRAFNNNIKRIQRVLKDVTTGTMSRVLAETTLRSIGLPENNVQELLDDAADGKIDTPEVANA